MTAVSLRIYDLSQGMARTMSPALLGKQIDGIWHTGIVVFSREYYFGGGICADPPGQTPYGTPHSIEQMGTTSKSLAEFRDFLSSISPRFSMSSYHLLDNNCNNFSDACCQFLLGKSIPQYILDLPSEAMSSPLGPFIRPMIEQMQSAIQQQSIGHEVSLRPSSEVPRAGSPSTLSAPAPSGSQMYWSKPITLENANRTAIRSKLKQFAPDYENNRDELLQLSLSLPPEQAFPALDLLRLEVAESPATAEKFAADVQVLANRFVLSEEAQAPACMMTLRGMVNCFKHTKSSETLCESETVDVVVECIATALSNQKAQIRKTGALLALNLAGAHRREKSCRALDESHSCRLLFTLVERLNDAQKPLPEEARPVLSALIVLVDGDLDALMLTRTFGLQLEFYLEAATCEDSLTRAAAAQLAKLSASG